MDVRDLEIVFHVGFHKTGTTFFQKKIFNSFDEVLYIGRSWIHPELNTFFYDFNFTNSLNFSNKKFLNRFYTLLNDIVNHNNIDITTKKMILVSHESLHSGSDYFGSRIKEQAIRLHSTFPNAKIIFSIRNQISMIESHYAEYVYLGGKQSFKFFLETSFVYNKNLKVKLEYDKVANFYSNLFNKSNIHFLVFEDVFLGDHYFLDEFCEFLNLEKIIIPKQRAVNNKLSKISITLVRLANIILAKDFVEQYNLRLKGQQNHSEKLRWFYIRFLKKIESSKLFPKSLFNYRYFSDSQKIKIKNNFQRSNDNLNRSFDLNLNKNHYFISNE